jgi:autotransporter-associated beta strand protein
VGSSTAASSLTLEGGGNVELDLGATNTTGGGVNDLIVVNGNLTLNGGSLTINAPGLVEVGVPYTVITYTGALTTSFLPSVSSSSSYTFTLNTSVRGQINLIASGGPPIWNGGAGSANTDWSQSANWNGVSLFGGNTLYFGGTASLNNTNDTTVDTPYLDITFVPGAGPFVLNGNPIVPGGYILNNSTSTETVALGLDIGANLPLEGLGGPLVINGGITNTTSGLVTLQLMGTGTLANTFGSNPLIATNGTNFILQMTNTAYNWTLVDNPSSTPISSATVFEIYGGTFNFGASNSAPSFSGTTLNGDPSDFVVGQSATQQATFNMYNGSLTTVARLDTAATTSGSVGNVNIYGGTMTLSNSQLQMDNIGGGTSTVSIFGGALNVGATLFVASRGTGTLNIDGGTLTCSILDVSRGIALPTVGVVNLNSGGTLITGEISTATANAAAPLTGTSANFNFNGGLLQASASSTNFLTDSTAGLVIPLTVTVKAGGAIINDAGHTDTVNESLLHDGTLGATNDGGLTKQGAGTVTLAKAVTYTGDTTVSAGTLVLGAGVNLNSSPVINIAAGATLTPSGGLTLVSNQTLMGGGAITGLVFANAGSTIAPGASSSATGTLTASGAITLEGATVLKINGTNNDELVSTGGAISYGGTLVVSNIGGPLTLGTTYTLFSGASYPSSFSSITLPSLGANLVWQTNLTTSGSIAVASSLPPSPPAINLVAQSGGNLVFSGTNGPASGTYYVLSSTNLALPVTNWTVIATNTFNAGSFSVTNPISAGGPPTFFTIAVP